MPNSSSLAVLEVARLIRSDKLQCPQSEEEYSVATICGFGDESHDLRVKTC